MFRFGQNNNHQFVKKEHFSSAFFDTLEPSNTTNKYKNKLEYVDINKKYTFSKNIERLTGFNKETGCSTLSTSSSIEDISNCKQNLLSNYNALQTNFAPLYTTQNEKINKEFVDISNLVADVSSNQNDFLLKKHDFIDDKGNVNKFDSVEKERLKDAAFQINYYNNLFVFSSVGIVILSIFFYKMNQK